ncbi:MFS transporter [Myxococcota bacterium]|nr:MFS transporter [Myxococcota bacterium]MBU1429401.1 MFS transporter [Myxococcota bacterium]
MRNTLQGFWALLTRRAAFRRLWWSTLISQLGDWLSYVAVSVLSLHHGHGALGIALVLVAHHLPHALLAPISGPLADRFDRRRLLIGAYVVNAALTLGMWRAALTGDIYLLQGLLFARVSVGSLVYTARSAALPKLVEHDELHQANALLSLTWSTLFAAGVALGGFLTQAMGPQTAVLLDALTFVLAAVALWGLPPLPPPQGAQRATLSPGALIEAWRATRGRPRLKAALLAKIPVNSMNSVTWVSLNLVAIHLIPGVGEAQTLGIFHATRAVGTAIGPLLPTRWLPRGSNTAAPLMFFGASVFALSPHWSLALVGVFLWGVAGGHNWVASASHLQACAPQHLLGRLSALDLLLMTLASTTMTLSGAALNDLTQAPMTSVAWGLLFAGPLWLYLLRFEGWGGASAATTADKEGQEEEQEGARAAVEP